MTALTETGLVNLALREIGDYRINDISDNATPAKVARDLIDQVRRMALQAHEWRFALKQAELAALSGTPVARYDTVWQLPGDLIRLAAVADNDEMDPLLEDFMVADGKLYSSTDYVFIEYIYDAPAYGAWPAYFTHYAAALLASEMASPLKSTTERQRLEELIDKRLGHARGLDSQQSPVLYTPTSTWLQAMRGLRRA